MKTFIKIIFSLLGIFILFVALDTLQALYLNHKPLLSKKEENGKNTIYKGLLVNHYSCENEEKSVLKGEKYDCPVIDKEPVITKIADTAKGCDDALEEFYRDDKYIYYYSCIKDDFVLVYYSDGSTQKVSDALKEKKITIKDLDTYNIKYTKQEIVDLQTLQSFLGGFIASEVEGPQEISLEQLLNIKLENNDYAYASKCGLGLYIIISTNNDDTLKTIDEYLKGEYSSYNYSKIGAYHVYLYNGQTIDLSEEFNNYKF